MRTIFRTMTVAAVLVAGAGTLGACSSDAEEPAAAASPTTTEAPTTIEASGTLLGSGPPSSAERRPDGSEDVGSRRELQGDLSGTLDGEAHLLVDYANAPPLTFTVFESTATFTGTVEGIGTGTLTFTTSAPPNVYDENTPTVETGTVTGGTGDLAGYEGTVEMTYTLLFGGAIEDGTYTVALEQVG